MESSLSLLQGMYTRDVSKKRKRWNDCKVMIQSSRITITNCDGSAKIDKLFAGTINVKTINQLLNGEELRFGSILVTVEGNSTNDVKQDNASADNNLEIEARASLAVLPKIFQKPFKSEDSASFYPAIQYSKIKSSESTEIKRRSVQQSEDSTEPIHHYNILNERNDVTSDAWIPHASMNYLYPTKSSYYRNRSAGLKDYVNNLSLTLGEEMTNQISNYLSRAELSTRRLLNIDHQTYRNTKYSTKRISSESSKENMIPTTITTITKFKAPTQTYLPKGVSNINQKYFPPKSYENIAQICHQKLCIPVVNGVEVIISPARDSEYLPVNSSSSFSDSKPRGDRKRRLNEVEDDSASDDSYSGLSEQLKDALGNLETKLFLKIPNDQKQPPPGCDPYSKGDIWLLWSHSSLISSFGDISKTEGANERESQQEKESRSEFLAARRQGYPFPFFSGRIWQEVWLVRWVRRGVSQDGIAQILDLHHSLTGSPREAFRMLGRLGATLPEGKVRGTLSVKLEGMRVLSDLSALTALTLLQEGSCLLSSGTMMLGSKTVLWTVVYLLLNRPVFNWTPSVTSVEKTLEFRSLLASPAFFSTINGCKKSSRDLMEKTRAALGMGSIDDQSSTHITSTTSAPDDSKSQAIENQLVFPILPQEVLNVITMNVILEFGLNLCQSEVLRKVSGWFSASSSAPLTTSTLSQGIDDSGESDILLVQGVFGSGKSHLMTAVCVLVKRLSDAAIYKQMDTDDDSCHRNSRRAQRVRCFLCANTNIAVDRVFEQLMTRQGDLRENQPGSSNNNDPSHQIRETDLLIEEATSSPVNGDSEDSRVARVEEAECGSSLDTSSGDTARASWPKIARIGCVDRVSKVLKPVLVTGLTTSMPYSAGDRHPSTRSDRFDAHALTSKLDQEERSKLLLSKADVIGVTCASTHSSVLVQQPQPCHILILDEATQVTEAMSLLPIACSRPLKIILVGDPKQLPPITATVFVSKPNVSIVENRLNDGREPLSREDCSDSSLFVRLLDMGCPRIMLRTQYRCHPQIGELCSQLFYDGNLEHGVTAVDRPPVLPSLPPISVFDTTPDQTNRPVLSPLSLEEKRGDSYVNKMEAKIIFDMVIAITTKLFANSASTSSLGSPSGINLHENECLFNKNVSIGVICMYKAQALLIREMMTQHSFLNSLIGGNKPDRRRLVSSSVTLGDDKDYKNEECDERLKVSTVDAFQGFERDIVIIATTRSSGQCHNSDASKSASASEHNTNLGFLCDRQRVNVALSRARHHVIVVGDVALLSKAQLWQKIILSASRTVRGLRELFSPPDSPSIFDPQESL